MTAQMVAVPQLARLVAIDEEIAALRAQQTAMLSGIVEDCTFMDVPMLVLKDFEVCGDPKPGDLCHVLELEEERHGKVRITAHKASGCDDWMCALTERTKYPKYAHVGSRYWATPLTDHVVVDVESLIDTKQWGFEPMTHFTLIPLKQTRGTDA